MLSKSQALRFSALPLRNLASEYPNHLAHLLNEPADLASPRALHPIFYGSYDWHSAVHGWWLLVRCLRRFPDLEIAAQAEALFESHFTIDAGRIEAAYFLAPGRAGYERPYGWGWLLALAAELEQWQHPRAAHWRAALAPLEAWLSKAFPAYLQKLGYPIRVGTHYNTAFGLLLSLYHAEITQDDDARSWIAAAAKRCFLNDRDYPAHYEPNGDDFLSGGLVEALLMARLLPADAFAAWFAGFLPDANVYRPVRVQDRADAKGVHLDGLNLSRAWCLRGIARALPSQAAALHALADAHEAASLPFLESGHYGGEHWLATFAALAAEDF